ncbi:energy transducer TonB [Xanthovirga aplysinae]|uniref:energy transducer TonB n=1 Tax=Xanthovirga aplysinae TaxID=2529853 RepID=UPI0012BCFC46|nr:energy transducer TonB [Xanthovirga aplysinae]MTI31384.1 energy transducer TonB [Xanthovirga aplysinae]
MKNQFHLIIPALILYLIGCQPPKDHPRLTELVIQDQKDRKELSPKLTKNDIARRQEVKQILEKEKLKTSNDYFNAGIVLQHGENPEDYQEAHQLAKVAVNIDPENKEAKILIAQSKDRYLRSTNKPQWYGTQRISLGDKDYLQPMDTSRVTERERKELGLKTLKELLNYFNKIHQRSETDISKYFLSENDSLYRAYNLEIKAEIIGSFSELIAKMNYPKEALQNQISGKVLVQYTIDPNGNVKDPFVVEGIGYGCDEEALRIIQMAKYKNFMGVNIERRTRIPFEIKS